MAFIHIEPNCCQGMPLSIFCLTSEHGMELSHTELEEINQLFGLSPYCEPLDGADIGLAGARF